MVQNWINVELLSHQQGVRVCMCVCEHVVGQSCARFNQVDQVKGVVQLNNNSNGPVKLAIHHCSIHCTYDGRHVKLEQVSLIYNAFL